MRRPQGFMSVVDPDAGAQQWDTFTCNHCNRVVKVRARASASDMGGHCMVCNGLICQHCLGNGCTPFIKKIEAMEERYYRRRQYEKMAGL